MLCSSRNSRLGILSLITSLDLILGSPASQHVSPSASYDLPLTWNPFGFLTNVSIGTPPQQITSFVDWTWISQYIFTTRCHEDSEDTLDCFSESQKLFNETLSSTFRDESLLYPSRTWNPNHFFFYKDLTVDYASDIERVGPSSARLTLQAADFQFNVTAAPYPFAGVFGLSPVFKNDNRSIQSPFYQMWSAGAWPEPLTAFHYCYNGSLDTEKSSCDGHDAIQTLGGIKHDLISGDISWYDVIFFPEVNSVDFVYTPAVYNYWTLRLTRLSIGDNIMALNRSAGAAAIFDHASYGRGAPLSVNAYQELVSLSGATPIALGSPLNNGNQSFFQVDCAQVSNLPPIKYRFGGSQKDWQIDGSNYVDDVGNDTCVLNIRTLGDGDMIAGNFGETFAKDKYIVFDFSKLKVGLADIKW